MKDKDFLFWIHERLVSEHNENRDVDYMSKLRSIIANMDKEQCTPNINPSVSDMMGWNDKGDEMMEDLKRILKENKT